MNVLNYKVMTSIMVLISISIVSCKHMSLRISDKAKGLNGSFELVQNGLPINWTFYTPQTVPNADFKIILDKDIVKDGAHSIKFDVSRCLPESGWKSPGLSNEFNEIGKFDQEGTYRISFWVRNNSSTFLIKASSVDSKHGKLNTLLQSNEQLDDWKYFEFNVDVTQDSWLRFQLNIIKPGQFWIDDIQIVKMN